MNEKHPSAGRRCRFSGLYLKRFGGRQAFGTVEEKTPEGWWKVVWDKPCAENLHAVDALEIGPFARRFKTVEEAEECFGMEALNAGLARNTRKSYGSTIREFVVMMKNGEIEGPVKSPLDSEVARNIIPLRRTA